MADKVAVMMKTQTRWYNKPVRKGDIIEVDKAVADRWFARGLAIAAPKGQKLKEGGEAA